MRAAPALVLAALGACVTPGPARVEDSGPPRSVSARVVRGGETIALHGADVAVLSVIYLNDPCPEGAQCITSGVARDVRVRVTNRASGRSEEATVSAGASRPIQGVLVRVLSVEAGPQATIDLGEALTLAR